MKRLDLVLILLLVTGVSSGCNHGKWRLRGAKCRPGMTMPTYAQAPAPTAGAAAPCNPGYPPAGFPQGAYPQGAYPQGTFPQGGFQHTGYPPAQFMPGGYAPVDYGPSGGYMPGETVTSENIVGEFTTGPIQSQPQDSQRPYFDSSHVEEESGGVIMVPGPETGPLPNG